MTSFKQDMPPPGGYSRIIYEKVPSAAPWTGKTLQYYFCQVYNVFITSSLLKFKVIKRTGKKTFAIVGVLMAIGAASTIVEKRYKRYDVFSAILIIFTCNKYLISIFISLAWCLYTRSRKIWLLRQDQTNAMEPLMLAEQHRKFV